MIPTIHLQSTARRASLGIVITSLLWLSGCALSTGNSAQQGDSVTADAQVGLSGVVHGGQSPIFNAAVNLYAVGYTGYGSGSNTPLATTSTNTAGKYSFSSSSYSTYCTANPNSLLYMTAIGGNTQGTGVTTTNNAASAMLAVIGTCSTVTTSSVIVLNEITTVASVFALAPYFNPGTGIGTETLGTSPGAQSSTGINNAASTIQNLAGISTGQAVSSTNYVGSNPSVAPGTGNTSGVVVTATPESAKLTTIASILASCVNQVSSAAAQCSDLFAAATPPPVASVTSFGSGQAAGYTFPTAQDTIQAALYMALNPVDAGTVATCQTTAAATTNMQCLFNLPTSTPPFQNGLGSQPTDWTIGITYSSSSKCTSNTNNPFFNGPAKEAVDASGNIWFVNGHTGNAPIAAITPYGKPLACVTDGGAAETTGVGIAIDPSGNIWATFDGSQSQGLQELNALAISTANGSSSVTAWPMPYDIDGIAIDGSGNIFLGTGYHSDNTNLQLLELPSPGATVYTTDGGSTASYSSTATYNATVITPAYNVASAQNFDSLAVDSTGTVWGTNLANELVASAAPATLAVTGYSVASGNVVTFYTGATVPAFTAGENITINGFASNSDPNAVEMNHQGFTISSVQSTTQPYSFTATLISAPLATTTAAPKPNGYLAPGTAGSEATTPTLTATGSTITDAATALGFTPSSINLNATGGYTSGGTAITGSGKFTTGPARGMAIDAGGNLYLGTTCCLSTNDFGVAKIFAPASLSNAVLSSPYIGGNNGVTGLAIDGASNYWFGTSYPSVGYAEPGGTFTTNNTYFVGEAYATGTTAAVASFTGLSPNGTSPGSGNCNSSDNGTTTNGGCPTGGGFVKANFTAATDIAIDPSGNVWVPQSGVVSGSSNLVVYGGSSITEIVGAAVPVVTPLSVAAGSGALATKPSGGLTTQTISFTPPANFNYGSSPVTLSATASSGLPVTFSVVSGPGSISGSILTATGIGTVVIAAIQSGSNVYAATSVTGSVTTLNPNPQTTPTSSTATTMTVSATLEGKLAPNMIGLKIGKSQMKKGYFATNGVVNQATLQFFQTLAPNGGTLGLGQGTEDSLTWAPGQTGEISNELTSTDTANLAAFMKALGNWKLIYGVNLGGMAPCSVTPTLVGCGFPTSPILAGEEVVSLLQALGTNWSTYLSAVEIGNEPDLDQFHESHSYCAAGTSSTDCGVTGNPNDATVPEWTESGTAPYGFEQTWESLHSQIVSSASAAGYTGVPFVGPDGTNVSAAATSTRPAVNYPSSWTAEFGADKASELSALTFHYYPFGSSNTAQDLLQSGGIDPVMIGPNSGSNNPTQPANGILSGLYSASAGTTVAHTYGIDEANSVGGGGTHGVSDAYASTLWVMDFILSIAQGYSGGQPTGGQGGSLALFNGGGPFGCTGNASSNNCNGSGNFYSPIYDNSANTGNTPLGVLPLYYGMMMLAHHVGSGNLYLTTLSTSGLNVTGYSVYNPTTGALYLIVLNKDTSSNANTIKMTATVPSGYTLGSIRELTQLTSGNTGPNISAAPIYPGQDIGITIQGQSVNNSSGSYTPGTPNYVVPTGNTVNFYVPPLSAVVVQLTK